MDRLRQGIFSSLGQAIDGARICDLFAGTGSYGLEALSRGAANATFIEKNRSACEMIKGNLQIVAKSMGNERLAANVICGDAVKATSIDGQLFDVLFVDPPYELIDSFKSDLFPTFDRLLSQNGIVVFEMPGHLEYEPEDWLLKKRIGKGKRQATACIYKRAGPF